MIFNLEIALPKLPSTSYSFIIEEFTWKIPNIVV